MNIATIFQQYDAWEIGHDHPADLGWFYEGLNVTHWQHIIKPKGQ